MSHLNCRIERVKTFVAFPMRCDYHECSLAIRRPLFESQGYVSYVRSGLDQGGCLFL